MLTTFILILVVISMLVCIVAQVDLMVRGRRRDRRLEQEYREYRERMLAVLSRERKPEIPTTGEATHDGHQTTPEN